MGNVQSGHSRNDFELAVRAAKDLELKLQNQFGAEGRGLHEKINSIQDYNYLPRSLVKKMRHVATLRNKLVHEQDFNRIPNRELFIRSFEESKKELSAIARRGNRKQEPVQCVIA